MAPPWRVATVTGPAASNLQGPAPMSKPPGHLRVSPRWLRPMAALAALSMLACGTDEPLEGRRATIHPAGFADDHRAAMRANRWDPAPCYACHDDDGPGACVECHEDGPDACDVCHRAPDPPHRAHAAFECATCHPVPAERGSPGHIEDRPEDVRFAGLARGPGHAPTYAEGRCADTACHAGPDAASPTPAWGGRLTGAPCGGCHGLPPSGHPADRCDRCHGSVIDAGGVILDPALHIDGRVQAVEWRALPCDGCHVGGVLAGADGSVDADARGARAHRAHGAPAAAAPVPCETCHRVPARNDDAGHLDDGLPGAEVIFSGRADGAAYRGGQCAETGCHGPDRPSWIGDAPCGTCHGVPPAGHPPGSCDRCHPVAAPGGGFAAPLEHVDGRLDVDGLAADDCDLCHGPGGRVALGGSHAAHDRYACETCHRPVDAIAAHLDGDPALTGRCEACHGLGAPAWGEADPALACDGCHGLPPPEHSVGDCDDCHPSADLPTHVDGAVDLALPEGCEGCHGMPDTGAHRAHRAPLFSAPVDCDACHRLPDAVDAPGHLGPPPAEVMLDGVYADGRCADTGCHAGPGAANPAPAWGDGRFFCGDCHGLPPPGHLPGDCDVCHSAVADGDVIADPSRHADGQVDFR